MKDFKKQWNLEMAMDVIEHETIDSKVWSEAAEWLLLYGPPEIQGLLRQASSIATMECFKEIEPTGFDGNGEPCYDVSKIAKALGMSEEEAVNKLIEIEEKHGARQLFDGSELNKIQ